VKELIVIVLIAIVVSLGQALRAMASGPDNSGRVVKALTWRISLSVGLFILLLLAWHFGIIEPHGIR
jgi:hypothetical protein